MSPEARGAEGVIPERLAAFGFLARGIVYLLIGGIAARVAILQRGRATGPGGALARILTGTGGRLVLWVVVAGLFAFVLFRVTQCVRTRRPLLLVGYAGSAIGGLVLAITALRVLLHFGSGGGEAGLRDLGARVLAHEGGRLALGLGGAIAAVAGAVQAVRALLGKLPADFTAAILPRTPQKWMTALARVGVFAHGVVVVDHRILDLPDGSSRESARARGDARRAPHGPDRRGRAGPLRARRRRTDRVRRLAARPGRVPAPGLALTLRALRSAASSRSPPEDPADGLAVGRPLLERLGVPLAPGRVEEVAAVDVDPAREPRERIRDGVDRVGGKRGGVAREEGLGAERLDPFRRPSSTGCCPRGRRRSRSPPTSGGCAA